MTRETFEAGVRTIKEHIAAGDIYQAVLSQRFEADVDGRSVHRLPRAAAREPVALHVLHPDGRRSRSSARRPRCSCASRAGASRRIRSPARGRAARNEEEDLRLAEELKRNEKERAEHVMLVDLGRNDLGRVCEYGIVRVPQYMALERYSHVMHLVSTVEGRWPTIATVSTRWSPASRPGRCRARRRSARCRSSSELEPTRRGLYAGAVGYLDFAGNLDFCIAIRTITMRDGAARVQAGAGIVADSNPAAEYEETRDKARALLQALEMAEAGLVDAPADRQLRLVHLQPRPVPRRAGRAAGRARNDAITLDEIAAHAARAHRDLAGPGPARRTPASPST